MHASKLRLPQLKRCIRPRLSWSLKEKDDSENPASLPPPAESWWWWWWTSDIIICDLDASLPNQTISRSPPLRPGPANVINNSKPHLGLGVRLVVQGAQGHGGVPEPLEHGRCRLVAPRAAVAAAAATALHLQCAIACTLRANALLLAYACMYMRACSVYIACRDR